MGRGQTHKQTHTETDAHRDYYTKLAKWADSLKSPHKSSSFRSECISGQLLVQTRGGGQIHQNNIIPDADCQLQQEIEGCGLCIL